MAGPFDGLMITPFAPAESSSQLPYDVFINHHGGDVKHGLATTIYNRLDATGLRVFLDKYELQFGDFFPRALQEAMRTSSIHIAIFSQNYAQSPWCLAELEFILQLPHIIFIPIFYRVEPSTLRWAIEGKGIYAEAFNKYEMKGRYSQELQRWQSAVHKASFYTGEIINIESDEEKAVTNVVNRVLKELEKDWLHVAKHPVGLDEAERDFHDKIALQSAAGPVQIVGIYGMGGAGKTTLAKRLYNNKCSTIAKSSFLSDVREAAKNNGLHEKQKELLKDLDLESKDFKNVDRGIEILRSRLRSVCVLIVLDDVDHTDQLDALLPARESLGHGSLIIVTTRELSVLRGGGISTMYKMRTLNPAHAEQLFCWHAFGQSSPLLGFEGLVKSFINVCHGLPLSLKVIGSLLYGESSKNYWQSQLDKLSRMVPDDIKLRLKISYDALDKEEKEMFLDVACFFIGWPSSRAIAVWDGSGWTGLHGWQRLVNKCLVEVNEENNRIRMHDHLRDLGREIANQHSPYRLWSKEQIIEIQPQQEAVRIRGISNAIGDNCYPRQSDIIINTNQGERSLSPASLGLNIFVGEGDFINEERRELSRELLCFECAEFEHRNLPSWLSMKKLRILELDGIEDLWGCDADAPLQLRELAIRWLHSFHGFPRSISHLKSLKKIILWSWRLSHLPEEFCNLQALEHLEIKWCTNLSYLPSNFGNLTNLQHLNLTECTTLKMLPDSCKKLTLLEYLNLRSCYELTIKPESHIFENMTKIKYLDLQGCKKLEDLRLPKAVSLTKLELGGTSLKGLPANIFQLTKLTELEIGSEFLTVLPTCLGNLSSLTTIKIQACKKLESLPDSLEHLNCLRDLHIRDSGVKCLPKSLIHLQCLEIRETPISELSYGRGCMLKKITLEATKVSKISICGDCCPFLETLSLSSNEFLREIEILPATLKSLDVYEYNVLDDIRGVRGLKNLQELSIVDCEEVDGLPNFAELESLETFELTGCSKVKKIAGLQELRSLQTLSIQLDELPNFAELTSLRKIKLQKCAKREIIERLDHLTSLEELEITVCPELDGLPGLAQLTSLKKIELEKCGKLKKIGGLESLQSLKNLKIIDCPKLDGLPNLAELSSLKEFELGKCDKLKKVEGLESLQSLETLSIDDCSELDTLPTLAKLTTLKTIELKSCSKLEKIESFKSLVSLEILNIIDCPELDGLPSLAELSSLNEFELRKCNKLKKVEGLENLLSLETLIIDDCSELDTLPTLVKLTILKEIELKNCNKLEKIESFKSLKSLETLSIKYCSALDTLPSLAESTSLKKFTLIKCHKLKKIKYLESLKSLETLRIEGCSALDTLPSLAESTSLKKFELENCNKLEKIESFKSLKSLEMLHIQDCPTLNTLPSLADLSSLKEFKLKKCNKFEKIEGLEQLTSLKKLEVHTSSKVLCILGLECHKSLKSLVVVADHRPVVEPFINDMQKWPRPRELIVCTRAVIDAGSQRKFFTSFPLKNVVEFGVFGGLNLRRQESSANANAILIFFSVDYPNLLFQVYTDTGKHFYAELSYGKWVWMGVFPEGSDWLQSNRYEIWASSGNKDVKVKELWLVMGEEGRIVEAFHQLSQS